MDITQLLEFGVEHGASDCHLSAGEPPLIRIDGDLKKRAHFARGQGGAAGEADLEVVVGVGARRRYRDERARPERAE